MKTLVKFVTSVALAAFTLFVPSTVFAVNSPNFPSCSNPNGTLLVNYPEGTHGIVGSTATYQGSDKVFSQENDNALQCFCSDNGEGVQTNWWKVSSLSEEQIQTLRNLGWYFVPNGSIWGLSSGMYMAKNESYSCGSVSPAPTPVTTTTTSTSSAGAPVCSKDKPGTPSLISVVKTGSKAIITWTKVDKATHYMLSYGTEYGNYPYGVSNTGNVTSYTVNALDPSREYYFVVYAVNDCMPGNASGTSSVGTGGQVLGLATTGDAKVIFLFASIGLALLTAGILLKKSEK
jgi:hypothetical protein